MCKAVSGCSVGTISNHRPGPEERRRSRNRFLVGSESGSRGETQATGHRPGLENQRILEIPLNGPQSVGDWVMQLTAAGVQGSRAAAHSMGKAADRAFAVAVGFVRNPYLTRRRVPQNRTTTTTCLYFPDAAAGIQGRSEVLTAHNGVHSGVPSRGHEIGQ